MSSGFLSADQARAVVAIAHRLDLLNAHCDRLVEAEKHILRLLSQRYHSGFSNTAG
ncbi:hypothetical protein SJ05684_c32220 [Sinorhizobium sojae CCBAU 05684]|uniref:Uncharacterized protein n=1 Tax=Sinorhizobium sojae CCBAU 05684 TaxID=716928 RepID=A0A249PG43_9HYPH|nr:hypothetical protein SJ05684_c32220 [Sinorhizobium sojae CCBAU 05684]